jgi:hypothetical protein
MDVLKVFPFNALTFAAPEITYNVQLSNNYVFLTGYWVVSDTSNTKDNKTSNFFCI